MAVISRVRKTNLLSYDQLPPKAKKEYDTDAYRDGMFFKAFGQYWALADGLRNHPTDKTATVWSGHFGVTFSPTADDQIQYFHSQSKLK